MFIPFYMAGHDHLLVAIAGVGEAGLSAIEGLQPHSPDAEILLIGPRKGRAKIGRRSETQRRLA
jgi:hypothetical protein